jgi:hypothetical protein
MEYNIYRLKDGLQPVSYQLPLKEVFVKKIITKNGKTEDLGYRRIKYVPGADTIYVEDIKGDLKPQTIWFEYGDLRVRKDDKLLNMIMTMHPWFNVRYELWSQESENKKKLEEYRFKGTARQLIEDADQEKIKAIALAVFGYPAISWDDEKCELQLREYADTKPKKLQEVMGEKDYESKLLAGHAFVQDIVKENTGKTAVVWTETDGVILKLAKGEKGITELGRFLSKSTEESELVLQSIGERLEKIITKTEEPSKDEILSAKDKEIAKLKAQLADKDADKDADKMPKAPTELDKARKQYEEKYKTKVPHNMKNNLDWITKKLS